MVGSSISIYCCEESLHIQKIWARIAPALQELTEGGMTVVLPTLQNLFLEEFQPSESVEEGIGRFISGRQLTDHPITISSWERDPGQPLEDDDQDDDSCIPSPFNPLSHLLSFFSS